MDPKILQAHKRNCERLFRYPNVVAVYIGKKRIHGNDTTFDCIKVGVKEKIPRDQMWEGDVIPRSVYPTWYSMDIVMTDVEQVG